MQPKQISETFSPVCPRLRYFILPFHRLHKSLEASDRSTINTNDCATDVIRKGTAKIRDSSSDFIRTTQTTDVILDHVSYSALFNVLPSRSPFELRRDVPQNLFNCSNKNF